MWVTLAFSYDMYQILNKVLLYLYKHCWKSLMEGNSNANTIKVWNMFWYPKKSMEKRNCEPLNFCWEKVSGFGYVTQ